MAQTANVRKRIKRMLGKPEWVDAGQNWQGPESELQLSGGTPRSACCGGLCGRRIARQRRRNNARVPNN